MAVTITIDRRTFLKAAAGGLVGSAAIAAGVSMVPRARGLYIDLTRPHVGPPLASPEGAEVLYNGITLPSPWPPYRRQLERQPEFRRTCSSLRPSSRSTSAGSCSSTSS